MQEKQLELSRQGAFFQDPFFADLQGSMRDGLKNQLAEFSARSMGVAGAGLNEAAHNIQVSKTPKFEAIQKANVDFDISFPMTNLLLTNPTSGVCQQ